MEWEENILKLLAWNERRKMKYELKNWKQEQEWKDSEGFYTDVEYIKCVEDIFLSPTFQSMEKYIQHGETTCRSHCIQVSYFSYNLAKVIGADYMACARAGLLHDLFLYDWHVYAYLTGEHFHGLTHPKRALINARENFVLTEMEEDIILKHMWPLTIIPPKHIEGFIVSFADKYCSIAEFFLCIRLIRTFFCRNTMYEGYQKSM